MQNCQNVQSPWIAVSEAITNHPPPPMAARIARLEALPTPTPSPTSLTSQSLLCDRAKRSAPRWQPRLVEIDLLLGCR
jgi:hypothetical protein